MISWRPSLLAVAWLTAAAFALPPALPAQVVAGRVTDDRTLQPASDYVVRLSQLSDTGMVLLAKTTTDPKGQFTVVAPSALPHRLHGLSVRTCSGSSQANAQASAKATRPPPPFRISCSPQMHEDLPPIGVLVPKAPMNLLQNSAVSNQTLLSSASCI